MPQNLKISAYERSLIVDNMVYMHFQMRFDVRVLFLAISLFDRCLVMMSLELDHAKIMAIAVLVLAAEYEQDAIGDLVCLRCDLKYIEHGRCARCLSTIKLVSVDLDTGTYYPSEICYARILVLNKHICASTLHYFKDLAVNKLQFNMGVHTTYDWFMETTTTTNRSQKTRATKILLYECIANMTIQEISTRSCLVNAVSHYVAHTIPENDYMAHATQKLDLLVQAASKFKHTSEYFSMIPNNRKRTRVLLKPTCSSKRRRVEPSPTATKRRRVEPSKTPGTLTADGVIGFEKDKWLRWEQNRRANDDGLS